MGPRRRTASEVAASITPEAIASFSEQLSRRLAEEPGLREELDAPTWAQPADRATRRYRKRLDRALRREGRL